ncbi:hypothetical protein HRI_004017900 [Hibiscus trionum]|uniref:Uncharacterized protein n=1 Tax=Hibiscus trionum TaxID=183268 RepID=A0A9W7IW89_HIBTR|nr:hypothetical protein HRI_004017600 [Hibiscus trionum]GMJ03487.1 hypothetical protein HRI_004017900 [Hibiscus trionum]
MAFPTTTARLTNLSGDTAMLVSSTYDTAPKKIRSEKTATFTQNISTNMLGTVVYNIGSIVTWIILWTSDNKVTTWIVPYGQPIFWKNIWDTLEPNNAQYSYTTDYNEIYTSTVDISSTGDAQTLNATITHAYA